MKQLPVFILVLAMAVMAVVTGCGHEPRYDSRLVLADSLMQGEPDSALAIVEGVCRDSLADVGDRAYRDLLLTQARYRCYVTATSDSDINRALAYYRAHPKEREKLTRAYIYKGAVMEELGYPDSAMLHYKHAEATAAPDDYFNLGYINLRISDLFLDEVSKDSLVIGRLHKAIRYFETGQDTTLLIQALGNLGSIVGYSHPDSAKRYLWRAIELACLYDSTQQYTHKSTLAGVYMYQKEYAHANVLAMDVLRHGSEFSLETQFYYYAAMSYIMMGKLDSARYVMSVTPTPVDEVDSLTCYNLAAELSKAEGNLGAYGENLTCSKKIVGQVLYTSRESELLKIDSDFDRAQQEARHGYVSKRNRIAIYIGLALLLLMLTATCWMWQRNQSFQREKAAMTNELEQALSELEALKKNAKDSEATGIVHLRLAAIQELYQSIRMRTDDDTRQRKIISLSSFLKSMHDRKAFLSVELNDSFWEKMRASVDGEYNGIYTYVKTSYPELTQRELDYFCLLCSGISPQVIMLCMNVTNAKTVTNYRTQIMKKTGLNITFEEFIEKYMAGDLK